MADDEKARSDMLQKSGRLAVPTIAVGNHVVIGFNRSELEKLLL